MSESSQRRRPRWYENTDDGGQSSNPSAPVDPTAPPESYQRGNRRYEPEQNYNSWQDYGPYGQRAANRAQTSATAALILGGVGVFTLPIILGPLAIWQANRARAGGEPATAGLILGWITTIYGAFWVIVVPLGLISFLLW